MAPPMRAMEVVGGTVGNGPMPSPAGIPSRPVFKGALGVIKDVVREDGILGLWRGMGAHLVSFMPQAAVWWASFEESKAALARRAPDSLQGMPVHFFAGISAGVINSVITNPLDTMKVRKLARAETTASHEWTGARVCARPLYITD